MGSTQSSQSFEKTYTFVQNHNDQTFQQCKIYRNNYNSNEYILQICKHLPIQQIQNIDQNLKHLKNIYLNAKQFPFLKIIDWRCDLQNGIGKKVVGTCSIHQFKIWIQYLRHDLKSFLEWRKHQNKPLTLDQVLMALMKAVEAYQLTKNSQFFTPNLNLSHISITTEGQMKFNSLTNEQLLKSINKQKGCMQPFQSCQSQSFRQKIILKRALKSQKQNFVNGSNYGKVHSIYSSFESRETIFLNQLKKFANELTSNSKSDLFHVKNPEDSQILERKQVKRLLAQIHKAKTVKDFKRILGQPKLSVFYVSIEKLRHQQSQAKFQRLALQLSQKYQNSQKTDYSSHESLNSTPTNKKFSIGRNLFIDQSQYHYY